MALIASALILNFIQTHGYFLMFLIMIIDGPIITYVSAFVASLGIFNIYLVFILSVLGNVIGDLIYYFVGKFSRMAFRNRYKKYFDNKKLNDHLKNHTGKAIAIIKIIPPLPTPGLILAGAVNVPLRKFLFYSVLISIPYSLFFTMFGFYSGITFNAWLKYFKLESIIILTVVFLIVLWFIFNELPKYLGKKYEDIN